MKEIASENTIDTGFQNKLMSLIQEQIDIQLTIDLEKKVEEFVDLKICEIKNRYSSEVEDEIKKVQTIIVKNKELDETKNSKFSNNLTSSVVTQAQTTMTLSHEIDSKKIPSLEVRPRHVSKVNI